MTDHFRRSIRALAAAPLVVLACALPAQAQASGDTGATSALPDWLSLEGSVRGRYETLSNPFVAGRTGDDSLFSLRTLLKAEARGGDLVVGGELLDARRLGGRRNGGAASELDALEPLQVYLAWRPQDVFRDGDRLDVTAGRFTMDIGSRRLVARPAFRNVLTQFEGASARWRGAEGATLSVFHVAPVLRLPSDAASSLDNEQEINRRMEATRFMGAHLQWPAFAGTRAEFYAFDIDENDRPGQATRNRDLTTWGARLRRPAAAGAFDVDLEAAYQTGRSRASASASDPTNLSHSARMAHAEAGYTFDAAWSPRLSLHYDFASGDKDPSDLSSNRFDPLFGDRSFEFGPTSLFGAIARSNLSSPGVRIEVVPDKRWDAMAMLRRINLDEARDAFGNSGVRDATGASGGHAGDQIEIRTRIWIVPDSLRLTVGGAWLNKGDFLKLAPNAPGTGDTRYGYTDLTWTF